MTATLESKPSAPRSSAQRAQAEPKDESSGHYERHQRLVRVAQIMPAVVLAMATLGSVALLVSVARSNAAQAEVRAEAAADVLALDIQSRVNVYSETIIGLGGLFDASDEVTREEFHSYMETTNIFGRFPGAQAFSWVPVVHADDVPAHEQAATEELLISTPSLAPFNVYPDDFFNDERFIVTYIAPHEGNEQALGFDIGSNPARRGSIHRAIHSDSIVATGPVTLIQGETAQPGMLLISPVYSDLDANEDGRPDPLGVITGVFRFGDLLAGASTQTNLDFEVYDTGLAIHPASSSPATQIFATREDAEPVEHLEVDPSRPVFDVAGRRWEVIVSANNTASGNHQLLYLALLSAVATAALTLASLVLTRSQARVVTLADQLTQDLRESNRELETSNGDLEKFAYVASHDLQTPARNVKNIVELLRSELPADTDADSMELLGYLSDSAQRMEALVQGLLEFSRIQHKSRIEFSEVDLQDLASEVAARHERTPDGEVVRIEIGSLPRVTGNATLLSQVVDNLLSNAVKYCSPERDVEIAISAEQEGSGWVVSVADNGLGIDERFSERIFEMFRRLHAVDTYEGTGIGLALCQRIVERHGGRIWIESELGVGSTFRFTIDV